MELYKYYRVDEYSKKVLHNHEIYFNTPNGFNDPFDSNYAIGNIPQSMLLAGKDVNLNENDITNMLDSQKRYYDSHYGMYCLTEDYTNILMWSHYADNHKGFCLEFDEKLYKELIIEKSMKDQAVLLRMNYGKYRPGQNLPGDKLKVLTAKAEDWSYEQECRLVLYSEENFYFPRAIQYSSAALKHIYVGTCMSIDTFLSIYNELDREMKRANKISFMSKSLQEYKLISISLRQYELEKLLNFITIILEEKSILSIMKWIKLSNDFSFEDFSKIVKNIPVSIIVNNYRTLFCNENLDIIWENRNENQNRNQELFRTFVNIEIIRALYYSKKIVFLCDEEYDSHLKCSLIVEPF